MFVSTLAARRGAGGEMGCSWGWAAEHLTFLLPLHRGADGAALGWRVVLSLRAFYKHLLLKEPCRGTH